MAKKHEYSLHNLNPGIARDLGQVHRDLVAHEMRWNHVNKALRERETGIWAAGSMHDAPPPEPPFELEGWEFTARDARGDYTPSALRNTHMCRYIVGDRMKGTLVDLGSGPDVYLGRMMYTNRRHVKRYVAVDYREPRPAYYKTDDEGVQTKPHFPMSLVQADVTKPELLDKVRAELDGEAPDTICTFEVIEHMPKEDGIKFLDNIAALADFDTTIFISTPCHDGKHMPAEHVYEWGYDELKAELEARFAIEENWGTFASQKDYVHLLSPELREAFDKLNKYYDSHYLATIFAPLYPAQSRNCIWRCRKVE